MTKIQMEYIHKCWISVCFIQEYVGCVKFAFKLMDIVYVGHISVQIVHVSIMMLFHYQSLNGLQSGFMHLYSLLVKMYVGICIALAVRISANMFTE